MRRLIVGAVLVVAVSLVAGAIVFVLRGDAECAELRALMERGPVLSRVDMRARLARCH